MSRDEGLVFDVGFHKGEDTEFYLRKGFRVVAFEASPEFNAQAKIDFKDQLKTGRLTLVEGAIAPASAGDKVTYYANPSVSVWGTTSPAWVARNELAGHPSTAMTVNRVDICKAFGVYGIPHYLKIDIEGSDRLVLEALGSARDRPKFVSIESEKVDFKRLIEELELLRRLGYRKFQIVQQEDIPGRRINTQTLDGQPLEYTFMQQASGAFGEDLRGDWIDFDEAVRRYREIFWRYALFGRNSLHDRMSGAPKRWLEGVFRHATGYLHGPLPGWFDTHAAL